MRVAFLAPELVRWDAAQADGLVAWVFSDERPPRGAAGLLDWRSCGRISRWMLSGRLTGELGEAMLFPPGHGLPFRIVLLLGAGPAGTLDETAFRKAVRAGHERALKLGLRRIAMGLPGRDRIGPRRAAEILMDECAASDVDVFLIEPPAAQKDMVEVVRSRRGSTMAP